MDSPSRADESQIVQAMIHWLPPVPPVVSNSTGISPCSTVESVVKTLMIVEKASIFESRGCNGLEGGGLW